MNECFERYPNDCKKFKLRGVAHACEKCPHMECRICKDKGYVFIWTGVNTPPETAQCGNPKHKNIASYS